MSWRATCSTTLVSARSSCHESAGKRDGRSCARTCLGHSRKALARAQPRIVRDIIGEARPLPVSPRPPKHPNGLDDDRSIVLVPRSRIFSADVKIVGTIAYCLFPVPVSKGQRFHASPRPAPWPRHRTLGAPFAGRTDTQLAVSAQLLFRRATAHCLLNKLWIVHLVSAVHIFFFFSVYHGGCWLWSLCGWGLDIPDWDSTLCKTGTAAIGVVCVWC
jgi:hypothetical protein